MSSISERDTGSLCFGHPNWTICSLLSWFCFYFFNTFLPFILEGPIPYYPRERRKGCSSVRQWGKGNHPKVNETQEFLYLGHSNWTICSLLSWFCTKKFPHFSYWKVQIPITPEKGRSSGRKWEKGNHPKVNETLGFLYLGHLSCTICSLLIWICEKMSQSILVQSKRDRLTSDNEIPSYSLGLTAIAIQHLQRFNHGHGLKTLL